MTALVLAGLLGVILAGGEAAAESEQATVSPRSTPASPASQAGVTLSRDDGPTAAVADDTVGLERTHCKRTGRLIHFGRRGTAREHSLASKEPGCGAHVPPSRFNIDPGMVIKPPNSIHYTMRIIVPKGCIDPGIFAPMHRR